MTPIAPTHDLTPSMDTKLLLRSLLAGSYFGFVLVKTEVVLWQRIYDMFHFNEPYMYLVILTAIGVGALSLALISYFEIKDTSGDPIEIPPKPFHKGVIFGGTFFGIGWAITGACPGPIFAQIGGGEPLAFITFFGAILGVYIYAWLRPNLPH